MSLLQTACLATMNGLMIISFVAIIYFAAHDMPVHSIASGCIFGFFAYAAAIAKGDKGDAHEPDIRL